MKPSFLLAFLLVLAAPGWAQQSNTTELRIVVVDETNAGIPGATIVVTPQGGEPITFRTDNRGRAISPPLPSGAAAIQIEYPGFEPYVAKLTLRRGAMNQTVTLKIAGLAEEVVVSDTSVENAIRSSTATTTLTEEEINALPDDPDELRAALEQLAGPGGATFFMNGFRGGRLPTRDEIRAIRIRQNVFSADTHDAGRASIEIITRPSPELSGNLNFGFKDSAWNARNAMARVETPEGEKSATVGLRGPIVRGRTSFRLNGQANSSFQSNTIIAVDQFGNSLGTQVKVPNERTSFTTALEHSLTDRQSLYVEYQRSQTQSSNQGLGAFDLPERAFERENGTNNARFRIQGLIGRATLHEVRLEFNRQLNEAYSVTEAPTIIVQDAFNMGGAGVRNRRLTQTFELADNLDFSIGRRHQMRVGLLLEGGLYETFDEQNKHGRFVFASLDTFREGRPLQYTQRIGTVDTSFMQYQVGFYWQDDIRVNNRLSIGVGVRNELQSHIDDRLNLMPRIGFTFNPRGNRTAIRGGYGVYYDWYEANLHDQTLRLNGISQTDLLIMNPGYPDPFAGGAQTRVLPGGRTVAAPDLRMPYQHQTSVSLERQLRQNWNLGVSYQMLRGRNQLRARDINTPIGGVRPNPDAGIITQIESTGRSQTDRVTVQTRFFMPERRLMFNMSYTYGRSLSHSNGPTALPSDSLNPDIDWGPSGQDIRHQLQAQAMLPLPLGFRANLQFRAQSGPAYNLTTGRDDNLDGVVNDRPVGVPRNSLRGDGYWNLTNIRLSKAIGFGGSRTGGPAAGGPQGVLPTAGGGALLAQRGGPGGGRGGGGFRGDEAFNSRYSVEIFVNATNPLNRVIPVGYSGNILSPFFGRATNVQPARRVDFGLALRF